MGHVIKGRNASRGRYVCVTVVFYSQGRVHNAPYSAKICVCARVCVRARACAFSCVKAYALHSGCVGIAVKGTSRNA